MVLSQLNLDDDGDVIGVNHCLDILLAKRLAARARAYEKILSGECEYLKPCDLSKKQIREWKHFIRKWNGGKSRK